MGREDEQSEYEDEDIRIELSGKECYICGRSEKDLSPVVDEVLKKLDAEIEARQKELDEPTDQYRMKMMKILEETEGNKNLDFKVETVESDRLRFKELIPGLDDLLQFKQNQNETLTQIVKRLEQAAKSPDDERTESLTRRISDLGAQRRAVAKEKYWRLGLTETEIRFADLYPELFGRRIWVITRPSTDVAEDADELVQRLRKEGVMRPVIAVQLCSICSLLFSKASAAAYNQMQAQED